MWGYCVPLAVAVGFVYVGAKGFTARGLPVTKNRRLSGTAGRAAGAACLVIGQVVLLATSAGFVLDAAGPGPAAPAARPGDGTAVVATPGPAVAATPGPAAGPVAERYEGRDRAFVLTLPPGGWSRLATPANPLAEVEFVLRNRQAGAMVVSESADIGLAALRDLVVRNVTQVDNRAEVVAEERRRIGGEEALRVRIHARPQGVPVTYYNLLYAGRGRAIQVVTWTSQSSFHAVKSDLDAFLGGFELPAR